MTRALHYLLSLIVITGFVLAATASEYPQAKQKPPARSQAVRVTIGQYGYEPGTIRLKKGIPARVTFRRIVESTCATEVIFPVYGIRRDLPLNVDVTVRFTPTKAGEYGFACGMSMHRGTLFIQ
jgi:Cu+-exporting ATPase